MFTGSPGLWPRAGDWGSPGRANRKSKGVGVDPLLSGVPSLSGLHVVLLSAFPEEGLGPRGSGAGPVTSGTHLPLPSPTAPPPRGLRGDPPPVAVPSREGRARWEGEGACLPSLYGRLAVMVSSVSSPAARHSSVDERGVPAEGNGTRLQAQRLEDWPPPGSTYSPLLHLRDPGHLPSADLFFPILL